MDGTESITAVIPFHNFGANSNHLKLLLDSLASKIEVVVVCDSISLGEFETLISEYHSFPNVIFMQVSHRSAALSRNSGLDIVASKWVIFLDCDDEVYIDKYLSLIEAARGEDTQLIIGQIELFDDYTMQTIGVTRNKNIFDVATYPAFTRVIYKRSFIGNLRFPGIPLCEDQCFLASLVAQNPGVTFSDQILYRYRVNNPHQGTNNLFDFKSHLNAVQFYDNLLQTSENRTTLKFLTILKFRILISMMKRLSSASSAEFKSVISRFLKLQLTSPWLLGYIRPRKYSAKRNVIVPKLILVGGLGNQIFQYVFMKTKFVDADFGINVNLGSPRISSDGIADIFSFDIHEDRFDTSRFLRLKTFICKYLLILSSHGNSGFVSRAAFFFVDIINWFHTLFNGGVGLVFLADGVGYFEDKSIASKYKYYIGCFHSYLWKARLDDECGLFSLSLLNKPRWLIDLHAQSESKRIGVVHIRRGDYMGISNLGYLKFSYFEKEMQIAIDNTAVDEFWIFTDDPLFVRESLSSDLISRSKLVDFDQDNASANLVAMSLGTYFILSNSTFSWWGAALSQKENVRVVVPKWWYADKRSPDQIYPPSWIQKEVLP